MDNIQEEEFMLLEQKEIPDWSKQKLYFITNNKNLKEILISGVIKNREGYKKYYRDFCELAPNCLPVFVDKIPKNLLPYCKEMDEDAVVAIELSFNLKTIKDSIVAYIDNNGIKTEKKFDFDKEISVVYLDGIISVNKIKTVFFENNTLKNKFFEDEGTNHSLDINLLKYKIPLKKSNLFKTDNIHLTKETLKISQFEKSSYENKNTIINSKVGCLSYLINNLPSIKDSKNLLDIINKNKNQFDFELCVLPKELLILMPWIKDGASKENKDSNAKILILILNFLANLDSAKGMSSEKIEGLKNKIELLDDKSWQKKLLERLGQMEEIMKDGGASLENFFLDAKMKSSLLKGFLLFLLYHEKLNDENLSDENIKKWEITEGDILFREIFYSTWKGWNLLEDRVRASNRPKDKKDLFKKLSDYYEYLFNGMLIKGKDSFNFKPFGNINNWTKDILLKEEWSNKIKNFAIEFAKDHNLECLSYEIEASSKDNLDSLTIKENSLIIELQGNIIIKNKIDEKDFKASLEKIELLDKEKESFNKIYNN